MTQPLKIDLEGQLGFAPLARVAATSTLHLASKVGSSGELPPGTQPTPVELRIYLANMIGLGGGEVPDNLVPST